MATPNKTQPTSADVMAFLESVEPAIRREEAYVVADLMAKVSGHEAVLWGSNLIGFGTYHYVYDSGREGDSFRIGFSPRAAQMTIYLASGYDAFAPILARLGPHKSSKACLYIKKLSAVDLDVFAQLLRVSWDMMALTYPS